VCDMDALTAISERHSIPIIEDAAPAFGATYRGRKTGTFGLLGCFSMNPMKVLGAVGEAGVVVTGSQPLSSKLYDLRYHGIRDKDLCLYVSLNSRLDTIQAAILSIRLEMHEGKLNRRQAVAQRYASHLAEVVTVPAVEPHVRHAWYHYTIQCPRRDALAVALQQEGIETRVYHSRLMPGHPAHSADLAAFPVGQAIVDSILCLPMHERLSDNDVDRVGETIVRFYGKPS
jgi:dTDP-4-amino-4,6-dideoxygalactose transaminase